MFDICIEIQEFAMNADGTSLVHIMSPNRRSKNNVDGSSSTTGLFDVERIAQRKATQILR